MFNLLAINILKLQINRTVMTIEGENGFNCIINQQISLLLNIIINLLKNKLSFSNSAH